MLTPRLSSRHLLRPYTKNKNLHAHDVKATHIWTKIIIGLNLRSWTMSASSLRCVEQQRGRNKTKAPPTVRIFLVTVVSRIKISDPLIICSFLETFFFFLCTHSLNTNKLKQSGTILHFQTQHVKKKMEGVCIMIKR